jgi:hypothetical protein
MQTTVKGRFVGGALYQAKETQSGMKFTACVVLEPGEEEKIRKIRDEAIAEEFGSKKPKGLKDWTLRKGDDEEFEHSFEKFFINPKAGDTRKPAILRKVSGVCEPTEDVYPGCYVHVSVNAFAYTGDSKKGMDPGVTLGLRGVLFWKDGEKIGGGFREDEFADADSEEDSFEYGANAEAESSLL